MKLRIPPLLQASIFGLISWALAALVPQASIPLSWLNLVAIGLLVIGLAILLAAVLDFSRSETTVNPLEPEQAETLVVSGLFRFTRNPMYLGMALVLSAWALYLANALAIIGPVLFVASITALQIKPEEEALGKIFGQDYAEYRKRVRRWL
jgi:protein-S-isoprenylcysteine O-methyltransferase Ste14